jgi:glutamine synthetase
MQPHLPLTREQLTALIADGEVDTVVVAFPDLQGRLVGKRISGWYFVDHVAQTGTENCDYLIATDLDDEPIQGYRFTSYERGYGDMVAFP